MPFGLRRVRWRAALISIALVIGGCSGGSGGSGGASSGTGAAESATPSTSAAAPARVSAVVALGDSVPYGTACDCTPYPELSASQLSRATGRTVNVENDAVAGYRTTDVLQQLEHDRDVMTHVRRADAVTVEVGANDIAHSSACGSEVACYEAELPDVTKNIRTIVTRIHELAANPHVRVVLLDYWSVWLGGQYAEEQGSAYVQAADSLTHTLNDAIRSIASDSGSLYVDLRTAFQGPDDAWDETHLLASDGEHPNAAGHERIAEAIAHAAVS